MKFSKFIEELRKQKKSRNIDNPNYWDSRYNELSILGGDLATEDKLRVISLYEKLQGKIEAECANAADIKISNKGEKTLDENLLRYIELTMADLSNKINIKVDKENQKGGKITADDSSARPRSSSMYTIGNNRIEVNLRYNHKTHE